MLTGMPFTVSTADRKRLETIISGRNTPQKNAALSPTPEAAELAVPVPQPLRQIPPRRSGPHRPKHGFQNQAVVSGGSAAVRGLARQKRPQPLPNLIADHKSLLVYHKLPFGSLNQKAPKMEILNVHRP